MNDFDRRMAQMQQEKARMGRDFEETKQAVARSQRRFENVLIAVCLVVTGVLLFSCWCVYHVLKAKRLVP